MITVQAIVKCDRCTKSVTIQMTRGYDDAVWCIPGSGFFMDGNRPNIKGLKGWGLIGTYFGERDSWSEALCPSCVKKDEIEAKRPKTLEERVAILEEQGKFL